MPERGRPRATTWSIVVLALVLLFVGAMVISFLLHLIKLLVYAAAVLIAIAVVRRAVRGSR